MILHVDMDAFYASVEERDRPELVGKPVIVGGTPEGRGVVAAANYVVRQFGVHSAMPSVTAKRLCPQAIVLPPRMEYYAEVSEQIRDIFLRYTPLVEPLSLDEAFLDVTGSESLFGSSGEIGQQIKQEIRQQLQLVASVGVAPNKFLAKIASDLRKPDGFVFVEPHGIQQFLDPLPVSKLWGVGRVTAAVFERLGVQTIGHVRALAPELLERHFGEHGRHLSQLAQGIDDRRVIPDRDAKSISHETTFARDIGDLEVLQAWVTELSEQVAWRLRRHKLRGRTVHLKIRFSDFRTVTRAHTLPASTNTTEDIRLAALELLLQRIPHKKLPVRLVGVGVSGFENREQVQGMLFDDEHAAQSNLDKAADQIRERFGSASLHRASGMLHNAKHKPMPRPNSKGPP
jgi:DNA polymerase-4